MSQPLGIAFGPGFLTTKIFERAFGQVAIAGVHRDDTMRNATKQLQRVLAREIGVAGIVVHPEARVIDRLDERAENVHFLGKLGVVPEVVLVVIFDDEGDPVFLCEREAGADRVGGVLDSFFDRELRSFLTTQGPAVGGAETMRHRNPVLLFLDLLLAKRRVGVGEIRRAAEHGDGAPSGLDFLAEPGPVGLVLHFEKSGIPFESLDLEGGSQFDPLRNGKGPLFAESLHVGFGKGGELGHGEVSLE